jgi:hypothetical protein
MTRLIELSRTIARDQIPEDRRRWYVPWAQRTVATTRNISAYHDKSLESELSEIANTQLEAAQDLQTAGSLNEELKATVVRTDLVGAEHASGVSFANASRIFAQGQLREVGLDLRSSNQQPVWQRFVAIAFFPFFCVALYLVCKRGPFLEWIIQWFFVFGLLIGIFWWLCLTPSIVGWLFVVVSVLGAIRSHVKRVRRRAHAT